MVTKVVEIDKKETSYNTFEGIKHIDENGNEYWLARELQIALDYKNGKNL